MIAPSTTLHHPKVIKLESTLSNSLVTDETDLVTSSTELK